MPNLSCYPQREASVAYRIFGSDAVLISTSTNTVRMLNPIGSFIWHLCDGSRAVHELIAYLVNLYDLAEAEAESTITGFLDELHQRQLIRWLEQSVAPNDSASAFDLSD